MYQTLLRWKWYGGGAIVLAAALMAVTLLQATKSGISATSCQFQNGRFPLQWQAKVEFPGELSTLSLIPERLVERLAFSADGQELAGLSEADTNVIVWNAYTGKVLFFIRRSGVAEAAFPLIVSSTGRQVFLPTMFESSTKAMFSVWDLSRSEKIRDIPGPFPELTWRENVADQASYSPTTGTLAVRFGLGAPAVIELYNTGNWSLIGTVDETHLPVGIGAVSIDVSQKGNLLAVGHTGDLVSIYKLSKSGNPTELQPAKGDGRAYASELAFSPDENLLAVALERNPEKEIINIYDIRTGALVSRIVGLDGPIEDLNWLNFENLVFKIGGRLFVSNLRKTDRPELLFEGDRVWSYALSQDRRKIAIAANNEVDLYQVSDCTRR